MTTSICRKGIIWEGIDLVDFNLRGKPRRKEKRETRT